MNTVIDNCENVEAGHLLATTALALSAGVATADVSFSGDARMGLVHYGAVAAVVGTTSTAGAVTAGSYDANGVWTASTRAAGTNTVAATATSIAAARNAVNAARNAVNVAIAAATVNAANDTAIRNAQENLVRAEADLATALGTAAVAAKTVLEKRMTVNVNASTETSSGITFGAQTNLRSNEVSGTVLGGGRVYMQTNGIEIAAGNIYGAIDSMPNTYVGAGLTGLGWGGMVANTTAKGSFHWDAYSTSGNGAEGVEVMYSSGAFSGHISYSSDSLKGLVTTGKTTAAYVAYNMGDWTVALGMQDSTVNADDKTILTVGGKVGDFGVKFGAANNDGISKISLAGSASFGATSVSAYVADEENAANTNYGLTVSHDLGGASLVGGVARTTAGITNADFGVSFSF